MRRIWEGLLLVGLVAISSSCGSAAGSGGMSQKNRSPDDALVRQARELLREVPLIDGHNDVPWSYRKRVNNHVGEIDFAGDTRLLEPPMHTDIRRLRDGGVGGQFWSVYIPVSMAGPGAARVVMEQIDLVHRLVERYADALEFAYTAADIERIHGAGKIASLIGMEGGHSIENSLAVLRQLYAAGARYMTITHWQNTDWADAATDEPEHGGLTRFGEEVVREMNRLGMLVDLSHVSAETMHDVLDISEAPVIFSHSSARALTDHPRNVPDEVLKRLPENGGVVMVTFVTSFVSEAVREHRAAEQGEEARLEALFFGDTTAVAGGMETWREEHPEPEASLADVADHIEHVRKVAGIDHLGIGSDFDGIRTTPVGPWSIARPPLHRARR